MKLDGATIAAASGGRLVRDAPAGDVLTDTRTITPGAWFLALVGPRFDGHDFVGKALEAGAAGVIADRVLDVPGGLVVVDNTTAALTDLGRWAREQVRGPVVGLTGSSGKTTTRALVALALAPLGRVHQTVGNLNNQLGVPMTLLATPPDAVASVVEMGTSSPGEIEHLAEVGRPTHRLIVNVGPAHLLELGGLAGVAREKGAMFDTAGPGDVILVNADDPWLRDRRPGPGQRAVRWGRAADADVQLLDVGLDADALETTARIRTPTGDITVTLPAFGTHFAINVTAALAVSWSLDVPLADSAAALRDYAPVGMRQRIEQLPSGALVLNDAYNANPASMKAALDTLAAMGGEGIAALGDMLELGDHEAAMHAEVAAYAAALGLRVLLVGPLMSAARRAAPGAEAFDDPLAAAARLRGTLGPDHRLLVKGSRGARMERILQPLLDVPETP